MSNANTIGPILNSRLTDEQYRVVAVWVSKKAACEWGVAHGYSVRDAFRIKAGSSNMSFTQWILRDACGMALTEVGFQSLERGA